MFAKIKKVISDFFTVDERSELQQIIDRKDPQGAEEIVRLTAKYYALDKKISEVMQKCIDEGRYREAAQVAKRRHQLMREI